MDAKKSLEKRSITFNTGQGVIAAAVMLLCSFLTGCATTVTVTPPLEPLHPKMVYFVDYGMHSGVLLPVSDTKYVEYLYGDWNWAALCHRNWVNSASALLISRQACLGRRYLTSVPGKNMPQTMDSPRRLIPLLVNGDDCQAVLMRLDDRWQRHCQTAVNPEPWEKIIYVKDDEPYSIRHDCNHLTADSLHEMGCQVHGTPFWGLLFSVASPKTSADERTLHTTGLAASAAGTGR